MPINVINTTDIGFNSKVSAKISTVGTSTTALVVWLVMSKCEPTLMMLSIITNTIAGITGNPLSNDKIWFCMYFTTPYLISNSPSAVALATEKY